MPLPESQPTTAGNDTGGVFPLSAALTVIRNRRASEKGARVSVVGMGWSVTEKVAWRLDDSHARVESQYLA